MPQILEIPNPLTNTRGHREGGRGSEWEATGTNFSQVENRGEPQARFWSPGVVRPLASSWAPAHWDYLQTPSAPHGLEQRGGPREKMGRSPYEPSPPMGAPLAHFGEQGIHIPMSSHTVGGGHTTRSSSPPYQPRPSSLPTPPNQGFLSGGWVPQGGGGQPVGTLLATGLAALGIFYSALL